MATISGETKTWHKVTVDFETEVTFTESPEASREYRLDVTFTNTDTGGISGNIWRANFNPPNEGNWCFEAFSNWRRKHEPRRADQANYLKSVDAYDHLVVNSFDGTSFQLSAQNIRSNIAEYRNR